MQVQLTATGGLERRLEVAIPAAQVDGEVAQRLTKISRTARLKGFRPGKAPLAVIRQQYGEQVHGEVINDLMRASFSEAVAREKLSPAGGPRIEPIAMGPGADLKYAAVFEVLPEVKLQPLSDLTIEKPIASVSDKDLEAMIDTLRQQRPVFNEVTRAAAANDRVTVDFVGKIEEQSPAPLDDAFAKSFGIADGNIETLRGEVRANMERELAEAIRQKMRTQVLEGLYKRNPLELPRQLVDEQIQELQLEMLRRAGMRDAKQLPPREPFEEPARRRVALGLLMSELVRNANLKVSREAVAEKLNELSASYSNPEEVRRNYLQNADAMRQIEAQVLEAQAMDWVVGQAKVTEKPATFGELTRFGETAN
jgi:trigger factor